MVPANNRAQKVNHENGPRQVNLRLIVMLAAVLALGVVAIAAIRIQHVSAHADTPDSPTGRESREVTGGQASETVFASVYVWAARMTVGEATDSEVTRLGYVPDATEPNSQGSLENNTFSYVGVDYTAQALFYQRMTGGDQQLVFKTDKPLPEHLVLHVGSHRFFVCETDAPRSEGGAHVWTLDQDLGWTEGRTTYAALLEPTKQQIEQGQVCPGTVTLPSDNQD